MARTQTMVQLSDDLLRLLDDEAHRRGVSRSALIREALAAFLHEVREASVARQIVEGYLRIPPGAPDGWGDLGALGERSTAETLQRLDAEEEDLGADAW